MQYTIIWLIEERLQSPDLPSQSVIVARLEGAKVIVSSPLTQGDEVGGIDLNEIDVDRQGFGVDIQFDPVEIQNIIDLGIDGFIPVIINFTPLPSVLPLLGLEPRKEDEFELTQLN